MVGIGAEDFSYFLNANFLRSKYQRFSEYSLL